MSRYRRIVRQKNSKPQSYQRSLIALLTVGISTFLCGLLVVLSNRISLLHFINNQISVLFISLLLILLGLLIITICQYFSREQVSVITIPKMSPQSYKMSKKIRNLFSDKQITDILNLSNTSRFGEEMPEIYVWIDEKQLNGYIAIENIANWERADREKFEQRVSGILSGKYQRFAVTNSELTYGDSYIIFHIEDTLTSQRLFVKEGTDALQPFVNDDSHAIQLSKDLVWHSDIVPHMSIIARTRAGKSVLAGRYMAQLMLHQNWIVEYNSAKFDRYVKEYRGKSDPIDIVERTEYWCSIMEERLAKINEADKEKYLEMDNMPDIALFYDELGNLNASLESLDKADKTLKITTRWTNAINRLSATGGSAGIHIIAISQFGTKEGFLPSLARANCSDAVIMLGGAADSADERKYLMSGFADMPKRSYKQGQGVARIIGSGKKWETPHFFEAPWFGE